MAKVRHMLEWNFKDKIIYQGEEVTEDSRKFEILVYKYLQDRYPLENWKLTKATRDGNRDIENICEFSGTTMWAEVKYTLHTETNISSRKYDSTLVSSAFENNLIKIFFISNTTMGANLIDRIKKYYYLSTVKKIAFVDGYSLAYWLKKHSNIEQFFFKVPLQIVIPAKPMVHLQCIRMYCKSDSYTIDSVLEEQDVYPLYLSKNYILEGEFTAYGFDNTPLLLYCNEILLYNETVPPEIVTFSLDISKLNKDFDLNKEYSFDLYYKQNGKKVDCGNYKVRFALIGRLYRNQVNSYTYIEKNFKKTYKKIYNIYGPQATGKSWLLNNLKNDLLKKADNNQKIIYINFSGQPSDIADICRLIFTLVFNFFDLSISATALKMHCQKNPVVNSLFNYKNIEVLIQALQEEDYAKIQDVLNGAIFSKTKKVFEAWNGFAYERFFFIDNINLLNGTNYSIFEAILKAFNPMKDAMFILTGRKEIPLANVENIYLDYIETDEILDSVNENLAFTIDNLNEIVPTTNYLKYPGLLHSFIQEINHCDSLIEIKQFYVNIFLNNAKQYLKGDFDFDNITLLMICLVKEGIPLNLFPQDAFKGVSELINKEYIVQRNNLIYPNYERWNRDIPQNVIEENKGEIISHIKNFIEQDSSRQEIYQCSLMEYYAEYYNEYFNSVYKCIEERFENNKYSKVIFLCKSLLKNSVYFNGDESILEHIKYYLAFSYMHCDVSQKAQKIFEKIAEKYITKRKDSLYFDAQAQVIDAQYWNFETYKKLPKSINMFRKSWKIAKSNGTVLNQRPYLTATNRMMVTYLALDKLEFANTWLQKNIKLAIKFESFEHIGYTYMDYAKGIYHLDLSLALKYLEYADSFFQKPSENRRHLDCQCEIQYVKVLLGIGNIEQLLLAQEALFNNQYWIQYYKCHLKLSIYYILNGQKDEALQHLLEAESPPIMKHDKRVQYLCSMISAFLYKEPVTYDNMALAGTSYQKIINNMQTNYNEINATLYNIKTSTLSYSLDPRVW